MTRPSMNSSDLSRAAKDAAARARLLAESLDHLAHILNALEAPATATHRAEMSPRSRDDDLQPLWTIEDVAAFLKASKSWVYHAAQSGRLPCIRVLRCLRFEPRAVKAWALAGGGPTR